MQTLEKLLTHKRSLRRVLNEMSLDDAESCLKKVQSIVEERRSFEMAQREEMLKKKRAITQLREEMENLGISIDDLKMPRVKAKRMKGQKVPAKYEWKDTEGNLHQWTGRGNMPRSLKEQITEKGKTLESFLIVNKVS